MSRSITDARQVTLRQFLQQIANASTYAGTADAKPANQSEVDNLLASLNEEVTPLLRLSATATPNLVVSVGAAILTNSESSYQRSIPHIGALLPNSFTSGTITFPASSGGTITVSPGNNGILTVASGNYIKVLIYMDTTGNLNVLPGLENAVEATATVFPAPTRTLPIGYVTLHNVAGVIQAIAQNKIYQFGTGAGGGSGSGDASAFLESLKNRLVESNYSLVTPYVTSMIDDDLLDVTSTAAFSLVDNTINFTAIGQTMVTKQLADSDDFLNTTDAVSEVELMIEWLLTNVDTAATYQVSRNGGSEWQTLAMTRVGSTNVYRGNWVFEGKQTSGSLIIGDTYTIKTYVAGDSFTNVGAATNSSGVTFVATGTTPTTWTNSSILVNAGGEAVNQDLYSQATITTNFDLNATTQISLSQPIVVASGAKKLVKRIDVNIEKTGAAIGNFFIQIVRDNAGNPSTALTDILTESNENSISALSAGANVVRVNISDTYLAAGTYHIVLRTNTTYQSDFTASAGARKISWKGTTTGAVPYARVSNAGSWSVFSTNNMGHVVKGITIDLRVKIISSINTAKLSGVGLFYDREPIGISTSSLKQREVFSFTGASNTSTFTLTKFVPDPDLLKVYDVASGQVYTYGAFALSGMTVVFEANQFLSPGNNVTLVFDQTVGGSFDNSDLNALLLANNHLGSADTSIDKSLAGRGLFLRRPDGTLREIAIDDSDNIVVYSV